MKVSNASTQNRRRELGTFFTYGACFVALGLSMSVMGPTLPSLAENVGVSLAKVSFIFSATSIGYLIGASGGGKLFDLIKGHRIMMIALGMMVFSGILIPLMNSYYGLLIVMFLFGLGQGLIDVGSNVSVLWVFQSRVGPYMNALHFFFGLGAFLSPIIVAVVLQWAGGAITWPFWVVSLLFLPGILGLIIFPSPENPEKETEKETSQKVNYKLVIPLVLLFFLYVGVEASFGYWIYSYSITTGVASEAGASYLNSFYWGALMAGRLFTIPLARKVKPATILFGNYGLMIAFFMVILIWPYHPSAIWIATIGLGLGVSSVFPTLLSLTETRMKVTGAITGLFFLGTSLAGMFIPTLMGQIFEYVGPYQTMQSLFLGALLGLFVLIAVIVASNKMGEKVRT